MTRINGADAVLLLLHEQIARLNKERAQRRAPGARVDDRTPEPVARLREIAARDAVSEKDLKHALVRSLLVRQFGDAVANDPAFEHVATDVMRIIEGSDQGRDLLDRALAQLGG